MPLPATADTPANVGGGGVTGTAQFESPGIPPATAECRPTKFELENTTAPAFVLNTVITGYLGEIVLTGGGEAECTALTTSGGTLTLAAEGNGPTGSKVECPVLDGTFTREGVEVVVVLTGDCTVNAFGTGKVEFLATLTFVPTPRDDGHVMTADFHGNFLVRPATEE
jgi:hypothetical protein